MYALVMGKKGNWFSSLKRTLSPSSKQKKSQKSENTGFEEERPLPVVPEIVEHVGGSTDSHPFPPPEEVKSVDVEVEPLQAASSATIASTSTATRYLGKSEEVAAIKIQTVFRGYLARRAMWGLRGLVRLKAVVEGPSVKRQTANTLKCTQSISHVQSQINSRRIRMSEENQALQRQLRAKEMASMQNGDEWNDSVQSKEEMEAKLLSKYEATMRRERAMAYSFSHQQPWKKSAGATNMLFMDPTNPQWGWSWSERYMSRGEKEPPNDNASVKSGVTITKSEIAKSYARHQLNSAPTTPRSKAGGPLASRKPKPGPSPQAFGSRIQEDLDDDAKSVASVKSEVNRRHSVAGSMGPAKSAKAKPRGQGLSENNGGSAKKHLNFQAKPRRHSGPPKVETTIANE